MLQSTPRHIPSERLQSLMALLPLFGPYRREQLRQRLLSAERACEDEASSLRRSNAAFASSTGFRPDVLPLPSTRLPTTPEGWEAEAAIYGEMAEVVRTYRPDFTTTH